MRIDYLLAVAVLSVATPIAAHAEKANVFFIHGANVSEQNARAWAAERHRPLRLM